MSVEAAVGERRSALTVAALTAKRAARSGVVWGVLLGLLIFNEAASYHTSFPTLAARQDVMRTFGENTAFAALIGRPALSERGFSPMLGD